MYFFEYNLEWKLYRAEQEIGKAYYGATGIWDQEGWQSTHDNEGYADSILGREIFFILKIERIPFFY